MASDNSDLLKVVRDLQTKVEKLEAEAEVRKLHHKYGYYLDKCIYREVVDLFANHPDTSVSFLGGKFSGKAGVKRLYVDRFANVFVKGRNGPVHGFLLDHLQAQDIVDYYPAIEGQKGREQPKCKARFRALMSAGNHMSMDDSQLPRGKRQWWEGGVYENSYVFEEGVWKILQLRCKSPSATDSSNLLTTKQTSRSGMAKSRKAKMDGSTPSPTTCRLSRRRWQTEIHLDQMSC